MPSYDGGCKHRYEHYIKIWSKSETPDLKSDRFLMEFVIIIWLLSRNGYTTDDIINSWVSIYFYKILTFKTRYGFVDVRRFLGGVTISLCKIAMRNSQRLLITLTRSNFIPILWFCFKIATFYEDSLDYETYFVLTI